MLITHSDILNIAELILLATVLMTIHLIIVDRVKFNLRKEFLDKGIK